MTIKESTWNDVGQVLTRAIISMLAIAGLAEYAMYIEAEYGGFASLYAMLCLLSVMVICLKGVVYDN